MVRVVVHERQRFLREALAGALATEPDVAVVGSAASTAELLRLCEDTTPDIALVGLDADDLPDVAALLSDGHDCLRIVGLHGQVASAGTRAWLAAGSVAVVSDDDGLSGVLTALLPGSSSAQPAAPAAGTPGDTPDGRLTARETQVMQHVAAGRGTREIAEWLGISPKTVDRHKQNVFRKLGVQNQAHAVAVSIRTGMLPGAHVSAADIDE